MKNLRQDYYNPDFTHIYIEKKVWSHPGTQRILRHFPKAQIIEINHYKDVFNRRGQDCGQQKRAKSLILAAKEGQLFYKGAPVCQDFGNTNFYYCSTMMNCIFDCSYCYLKGMYPSGHMVIFVNLEDYFAELERMLRETSVYLCLSYDADLLAVESVTGYVRQWAAFASQQENLKLEVRTKSARAGMWRELPCLSNVIYAFTISPQPMIEACELGTPSAAARLACALEGLEKGFPVRLCFDPMICLPSWKEDYGVLLRQLDEAFSDRQLSMNQLTDVSVGCFRISSDYMKQLRRVEPASPAVQFPYVNVGGVCQYPPELLKRMEDYMITELQKRMDKEKIYHE